MNVIDQITKEYKRSDLPNFKVGDTVKVHVKIKEGSRERIQVFEGFVLKRQSGGVSETFTVRKISSGVGVEKTFPLHSPKIEKIEIVRNGNVRRAKLNYMRQRTGKSARIKNRVFTEKQLAEIEAAEKEAEALAAQEAEALAAQEAAEKAELEESEAKAPETAAVDESEKETKAPAEESADESDTFEEPADESVAEVEPEKESEENSADA